MATAEDFPSIPMVVLDHPQINAMMRSILLKNADVGTGLEKTLWGILSVEEKVIYPLVRWVADTNHVLQSLNLLINDIAKVEQVTEIAGLSLSHRLYTLTRAFFSEFYRAREAHARYQADLVRMAHIDKEESRRRKRIFHEAFSEFIEKRNTMTHGFYEWGEVHVNFQRAEMMERWGYGDSDPETGRSISSVELLLPALLPILSELTDTALKLHSVVEAVATNEGAALLRHTDYVKKALNIEIGK